jgi:GMP synthase-like glutamine amidotransferase
MKIHILQHENLNDSVAIEKWAKLHGHSVTFTKFYQNEKLPALDDFDWLLIMGGTMNVYEEEKFPWLKDEKCFIKKTFLAGKIIAGCCLGGQLLADVLGGKVTKNKYLELGWHKVRVYDAARENPVCGFLPPEITVFQWHEDTFSELPPGAICIAGNDACSNQGFVYKDTVFALQFHFEINTEMLKILEKEFKLIHSHDEYKSKYSGLYVQTAEEIFSHHEYAEQSNNLFFRFLTSLENKSVSFI